MPASSVTIASPTSGQSATGRPNSIKQLDNLMQAQFKAMQVNIDTKLALIVTSIESLQARPAASDVGTADTDASLLIDLKSELVCSQQENATLRAEVTALRSIIAGLGLPPPVVLNGCIQNSPPVDASSLTPDNFPPFGSNPVQPRMERSVHQQFPYRGALQQPPPTSITHRPTPQKAPKILKGTGKNVGSSSRISGCPKPTFPVKVFVSRLAPDTETSAVKTHMNDVFSFLPTDIEQLTTKHDSYTSFLITTTSDRLQDLLDGSRWPADSFIKRWYPARPARVSEGADTDAAAVKDKDVPSTDMTGPRVDQSSDLEGAEHRNNA